MQTDRLFYMLLQTVPGIVLELLGKPPSSAYTFQAVEVKETAFRFDGVLMPTVETADQPTIFVEVQFQKDAYFYHRFFSEIFIFLRQNPEVTYWQAIVLFEKSSREPERQQPFLVLLNSDQVHRIYLEDLRQISSVSLEVAIVQLIVTQPRSAMQFARQLLERAKTQSDSSLSLSQIMELIETIVIYKFPTLTREAVATMLGIDELKQTRVYRDALEEGRQEGRQEGQCQIILRQLTRKLGQMPDSTVNEIRALSDETLCELGDRLLDLSTLEELNDYLADA